jgi:hypothetical protein
MTFWTVVAVWAAWFVVVFWAVAQLATWSFA